MMVKDLYDQDFVQWTTRNAELLRAGRWQEADLEHIAEEIEDMGKSRRRALESRLEVLLTHLLKWQAQPERRAVSPSWRATIKTQRSRINRLLREAPSLRNALTEDLAEAYEDAVTWAAAETGLPEDSFPASCPFPLEQIMDPGFYPQ